MTTSHALTVAERLLDPATVVSAVDEMEAASLNRGLAGTALLHARLSTIDPTFTKAAIRHWNRAADHLRRHPTGSGGIQGGQGGLAASLIIGSTHLPNSDRLHTITVEPAKWLSAYAVDVADQHHRMRATSAGAPWHIYDSITGLAGIGRVLLAAAEDGYKGIEHGLRAALKTLTEILAPCENPRPGWWLSCESHPEGVGVDESGAAGTGLAHGVAGPLAFLSTAHTAGWSIPGQAESVAHAATWLLAWRTSEGTWPPLITGSELDNHIRAHGHGRQDAWCYGTPGITRALHLAGQAFSNAEWTDEACSTAGLMAERTPNEWDVDGPTLCHGHAGVMQATARTSPSVADAAATAVIDTYDPATPFGFQHHEGGINRSEPGFLTGASGVALALAEHAALPSSDNSTPWGCLLNLA